MPTADCRRFARWDARSARLLLAALTALVGLAILALPVSPALQRAIEPSPVSVPPSGRAEFGRDTDLMLYDSVIAHVAAGKNYYAAAIAEQRARSFPVRPGFAVRLPTLATIEATIGPLGTALAAISLLGAIAVAWWRRFGDEGADPARRRLATALVVAGSSFLLNPTYHVLHELWAGGLVALALGLHRPGRWHGALAVVALALAIRELVLPFVLLMAAMAAWRRDWQETAAWAALAAAFVALLAWHLSIVAGYVEPSDSTGPSWLALRGLAGWLGNLVQSSQLHLLPWALAAPLPLLAVLGWCGWRTPAGAAASLLLLGYGAAFMIAGRENNFYWGLVVTPVLFAGLAFAPGALHDLARAASRRATREGLRNGWRKPIAQG